MADRLAQHLHLRPGETRDNHRRPNRSFDVTPANYAGFVSLLALSRCCRPRPTPPPQIYIKHAVDNVKFDTNWGRVYYANLLGSIPLIFIGGGTGEAANIVWSANGIIALLISCVFGCAMSYFAFLARSLVSATSFTVLGTVCKLATVAINVMMWDNHASPFGLACLGSTLFSAYFYRQSPLRKEYQAVASEGGK